MSLGLCVLVLGPLTGCQWGTSERPNSGAAAVSEEELAAYYLEEAEQFLNEGNQDAALRAFARVIEENPRILRAHLGVGDIYFERGEYGFAEQAFREAREVDPRSFDAAYFHGLTLQLLNRIGEAIRAYRKALTLRPNSHEANLNLATAYLQLDQPAEALPFAEASARLLPEHGPTRVNLGTIYSALGRDTDAVDEYQAALELMEPSPEIILNLVDSLRKTRRYPEMVNSLAALIRMEPSPAAYERLGYAYFQLRRFPDSEQAYRDALGLDGRYYPAMNGLAVNLLNRYLQSNRSDQDAHYEAVQMMRRSLQIEPNQDKIVRLLTLYGR